jgi:hypothetical protein
MHHQMIADVTFGVTSLRGGESLNMCLTSVLCGHTLPLEILVRLEGPITGLSNYYFQAIAGLARLQGVKFRVVTDDSGGIRVARDYLLSACNTNWLWMGDDDVVFSHDCLKEFGDAILGVYREYEYARGSEPIMAGVKVDILNTRKYLDWDTSRHVSPQEISYSQNHLYHSSVFGTFQRKDIKRLDTGNVMFNIPRLQEKKLTFSGDGKSVPEAGGEDDAFAVRAYNAGVYSVLVPYAEAYHLEKSVPKFNQEGMRKEMLRLVEGLNI